MDLTTISSLGDEALSPLHKAIAELPSEQRSAGLLKAQQAVRAYVAAAGRGETPDPAGQSEPVARAVFEVLSKAAPAQPPLAKSAAEQADDDLSALVKAQTAKAQDRLEKGMLGALGIGRRAGMRAMMAGARQGKERAAGMFRAAQANNAARRDEAYALATRGMPAGPGRHAAGMAAAQKAGRVDGWIPAMTARNVAGAHNRVNGAVKRGAEAARDKFQRNARRTAGGAAMIGALGGLNAYGAYDQSRSRRRSEED